jgi:hypothetical protein
MTPIKNVKPLSAEVLFDLLKKEFADYINGKLNSNITIEYGHVYDVINVLFPEVIEGNAFTITISDDEITLINNATTSDYNTELLEQNLNDFLAEKAG